MCCPKRYAHVFAASTSSTPALHEPGGVDPTPTTQAAILDQLEAFVTTALGKSVVRAKDTPNFIANRVGIAGMLATMKEAETFGLTYDVVDDLTGKKLGRASSGTFRTADVVGLDTMAHVIKTLQDNLKDDPFYSSYATPAVVTALIAQGALGQKSGAGFYKKVGKDILRLDPAKADYVAGGGKADEIVARMLKKPAPERLKLLRESSNPQAQFLWAILRDSFHYCAVHLAEVADSAREIDFAMRWGFGSTQGPFELWQEAGWKQVAEWVKADIEAGKALSKAPLPAWVFTDRSRTKGVCIRLRAHGAPRRKTYRAAQQNCRFISANTLLRASAGGPRRAAQERAPRCSRTTRLRVWTLDGEVLIASITAKLHLISPTVSEGLVKAVELAEQSYQGLVIWSPDDVFSAGANLEALMPIFMKMGAKGIAPEEKKFQDFDAAHSIRAGAGGQCHARHRPGRGLRAGGVLAQNVWPRWRVTSAWWRWAWACCRVQAASPTLPAARQKWQLQATPIAAFEVS
jgi:3-hydroxyacyl-CoA dehydrogenase